MAKKEYGIELLKKPNTHTYDGLVIAVAHDEFKDMGIKKIRSFCRVEKHVVFDLKYLFPANETDIRL